jgi:hypothetical protein
MAKRTNLPDSIRAFIGLRAAWKCEYCGIPEEFSEYPFHIDHIVSLKHGGESQDDNLAYSCPECNFYKGSDIGTYFSIQEQVFVPFFNPRIDVWSDHFQEISGLIKPLSTKGEVTVRLLQINTPERIILRRTIANLT